MRIRTIRTCDINNGPGVRVTLWVQGCTIGCKGCHNPDLQDLTKGIPYTEELHARLIKELGTGQDFSVLGGEPLDINNRTGVCEVLKSVRSHYPDKHIMVWTGHYIEELWDDEILNYIDVLVDGPFILEKHSTKLNYRGSSNQRIIDVPSTLKSHKVVLKYDYYEEGAINE